MTTPTKGTPRAPAALQPTSDEFAGSLGTTYRHWYEQQNQQRELTLQKAIADLSRGLAPIFALHGELLDQRLHWESNRLDARDAVPSISWDTLVAYRQTRYIVDLGKRETFDLRIGQSNRRLADLHARHKVTSSVFVTAHNPFGQPLDAKRNDDASADLRDWIERTGHSFLKGRGAAESGEWLPEESFLVLGASLADARALCALFRQNAVVFTGTDATPSLVLHPDATLV